LASEACASDALIFVFTTAMFTLPMAHFFSSVGKDAENVPTMQITELNNCF